MPIPLLNSRYFKALFIALFFLFPLFAKSQSFTLVHGFAHNDYRHRRPLFDAENNGYTHIEADVFLHDNKLVVAHINPYFKRNRTLENLYLAPLFEQVQANNGSVYQGHKEPLTFDDRY